VVDDDRRWQNTFDRLLKVEGYSLTLASSYQEAIEVLEKEIFHLAIVDIRLVDWDKDNEDGLKILFYMKNRGLDKFTKSIIVTGFGTTDRQRRAFKEYDVLDFIPKEGEDDQQGINRNEFIEIINQAFSLESDLNQKQTRLKALIVDDDKRWRATYSRILESEGYQVKKVKDYNTAITEINRCLYPVVIIDLRLSTNQDVSGLRLVKKIDNRWPADVHKIVVSGEIFKASEMEQIAQLVESKNIYFLSKGNFEKEKGRLIEIVKQAFAIFHIRQKSEGAT
jgi:ActR/RegA family two-component response regulator